MSTRIGIVDDKPMLINSLQRNLSMFNEVEVMFTAGNGVEALHKLGQTEMPQVILMDIEMPQMNGIEATLRIRKEFPEVKVIILSVFDQDDKVFDAILAGASGYLLKDEKPSKIVEAIEEVMEGGAPMSPKIAIKTLEFIRSKGQTGAVKSPEDFELSDRELEILGQIAVGLTYQQIAEKLFISPKTVRKHIENIYQKLHVHSKVDAVKLALKNKWFSQG